MVLQLASRRLPSSRHELFPCELAISGGKITEVKEEAVDGEEAERSMSEKKEKKIVKKKNDDRRRWR